MADTGYGVTTRALSPRLNEEYDVYIHSVGGWEGMGVDWQGMDIFPSGMGDHGERSIPYWFQENEADVVFSHHDHWSMGDTFRQFQDQIPTVLYTILDHDLPEDGRAPESVVKANEKALKTVVMSEYAEEALEKTRIPDDQVHQIPHGVDTTKYAPVTDAISDAELKRDLGVPEDAFLFGMVAANYGPRKNIPNHVEAFNRLVEDYGADDAYFYIHTHPTMSGGYNLYDLRNQLDIEKDRLQFPDPHRMYHGIEDLVVVQLYNTFDVHLNVTQSESWGLTITEALATETPVIAANNSAQTEQLAGQHDLHVDQDEGFRVVDNGILVNRGNELWTQNAVARRWVASTDDIYDAMVYAYENRDEMEQLGQNGRQYVKDNYQWDDLWENDWKPLWEEVEEEVDPDKEYSRWYMERRNQETQSQAFQKEAKEMDMDILGDSVLDVGCGPGTLVGWLDERGYDAVGVDHAEAAIEFVENERDEDLEVYQQDATDLEFKDDAFDTVLSQHVIEHIEADGKAVAEMARVAKKKVAIITPKKQAGARQQDETEVRRYDETEIERMLDEFGAYASEHYGIEADDYEVDYEPIAVSENNINWKIVITLDGDTGE